MKTMLIQKFKKNQVETKTKGRNKTMNSIIKKFASLTTLGMLALGILSLGAGKASAHSGSYTSTSAAVDVMVTPVVTVDLTASPTFYNFGLIGINTSSFSAIPINLQNTGNIGVTMQKHGNNTASGNWTINTSSGLNKFTLYAATASARPAGIASFASADKLPVAASPDNLQGIGGSTQVSMNPTENVSLWFRIDMPTATTTSAAQTIPVHFIGNAQ